MFVFIGLIRNCVLQPVQESEIGMSYDNWNLNKNHRLTVDDEFNSMPLMNAHAPMVTEYLEALYAVIFKALEDYRRVFAFRFDLHLPVDVVADAGFFSNAAVSRFVASLKAKIEHNRGRVARMGEQFHDTKVRYFWVREIGESQRVHYHFVVFLNGDAFNWLGNFHSDRENMANRIWESWASALGMPTETVKPLVHFPENPSYMLQRNNPASVEEFFYRASYLCKARTKQYGYGHHGYGASKL